MPQRKRRKPTFTSVQAHGQRLLDELAFWRFALPALNGTQKEVGRGLRLVRSFRRKIAVRRDRLESYEPSRWRTQLRRTLRKVDEACAEIEGVLESKRRKRLH